MNRTVLIVGAAIVAPLLVLLAVSFRFNPREIPSPLVGTQAPPFVLEDLNGAMVDLNALRGKPVVLNFWATWCQPCVVEHPVLREAAFRYRDRAAFLGIIYQDEPEAIARFLIERGEWGPALVDPGSRTAISYGVYGAPETFILDRDGVIVEKVTGILSPQSIDRLLGPLL